jgi:antitoxin (DNA-binding transcriptional repressor) of toxin-antitoxin stability system
VDVREIEVRELEQSLNETLAAVGRGERVRVTICGKAVADIVPLRSASAPRLAMSRTSASELVLAERDEER